MHYTYVYSILKNPVEIASGLHQNVLWYNITFERDSISNGSKTISVADSCTAQRCEYNLSTSFFGSHYTLSVAAENIAGLGEHLTCTPDHISMDLHCHIDVMFMHYDSLHTHACRHIQHHGTSDCQHKYTRTCHC